jgi:hypothetical protein
MRIKNLDTTKVVLMFLILTSLFLLSGCTPNTPETTTTSNITSNVVVSTESEQTEDKVENKTEDNNIAEENITEGVQSTVTDQYRQVKTNNQRTIIYRELTGADSVEVNTVVECSRHYTFDFTNELKEMIDKDNCDSQKIVLSSESQYVFYDVVSFAAKLDDWVAKQNGKNGEFTKTKINGKTVYYTQEDNYYNIYVDLESEQGDILIIHIRNYQDNVSFNKLLKKYIAFISAQ